MLNSSSIMTDSTGVVAQTLDYYPFGEIRIDTKPAGSTFNEQRKYIGQEYDQETGLNYLNARYYNSVIGRFISQDPVSLATPEKLLTDPQQLNLYSYARNNPVIGSDPSGLIVVTLSGTNPVSLGGGKVDYLKDSSALQDSIKSGFKGQDIKNFDGWSGANSDAARQQGAKKFGEFILETMKSYPANEPLNVVCHSHGCNVAALYTQQSDAHQINNLISFGQPVRSEYANNENKVNNHINVYSNIDMVQLMLGGHQTSVSAVAGGIAGSPFGPWGAGAGFLLGQMMDIGDLGIAGRTVPGANNLNVTDKTPFWSLFTTHSDLLSNPDILDRVVKNIK